MWACFELNNYITLIIKENYDYYTFLFISDNKTTTITLKLYSSDVCMQPDGEGAPYVAWFWGYKPIT